nr:response regulator [Lysinibacillus timonensis]
MKVRTKFLLAISTLPLFLFIILGVGWYQVVHLNNASNIVQTNYDQTVLAGQIRADVKDEGLILRNLIIFDQGEAINQEIAQLTNESQNIRSNIDLLKSSVQTREQEELVNTLIEANTEYQTYVNEVINLINNDRFEEAKKIMDESSDEFHDHFSDILSQMTKSFESNLGTSLTTLVSNFQNETILINVILAICILTIILILLRTILPLTKRISSMSEVMSNISNAGNSLDQKVEVLANDEFDEMAKSFNQMIDRIAKQIENEQEITWKKTHITDITTKLSGTQELETLGHTLLSKLVPLVESSFAAMYVKDLNNHSSENYQLVSAYGLKSREQIKTIQLGEGLTGQAILEKKPIFVTDVPSDYIHVSSSLGEALPLNLVILPICFEGEVKAVIELASFKSYSESQKSFLKELIDTLGIVLDSIINRIQLAKLLEETQTLMEEIQAQSEELQNQQEELRATNEELEEQTQALRQSELKLQMQQEELEQTNVELEEKAKKLEEQNLKYDQTNREVEKAKHELELKAEQLALSSKYKSEFLANMSHELRTPLNSLLILSKLLADNPHQNLTGKQIEYAKTIYSSGHDLLVLINDILDLAKIESGKTEIIASDVSISSIQEFVHNSFSFMAESKNLDFEVIIKDGTPQTIYNDEVRIHQILKNLLSNAFKFTEKGRIQLVIGLADHPLAGEQPKISLSVIDTGIGIAKEKLNLIFEAFQQADGTTSRKFGGTGLGLSISRELAALLGGEISVESEEGKGSTFTFIVGNYVEQSVKEITKASEEAAPTQEAQVELTEPLQNSISFEQGEDESNQIKRLLIVDDDINQRNSLMELIGGMDFIIKAVSTGHKAIELLKVNQFDCVILDLGLTDTSGFDLLEEIKRHDIHDKIKVFIYTGRELTTKEEMKLSKYAHTIIIKNQHSPERLKSELELYLNKNSKQSNHLDENSTISHIKHTDVEGKKILLVDDDIRNVFALSSVLEMVGYEIVFAENGIESLHVLQTQKDIDLVLMDIMMPEMDGYEAIQKIRNELNLSDLPIIALTAKAMKEDREKCLAIGASDYIAKPVNPDQLISLMKVWLY